MSQKKHALSTIRAWEQHYGFPLPHRTDNGHRRSSLRDIALIEWLHQCTAHRFTTSHAIELLHPVLVTPGEWWASGRISVSTEHVASHFISQRLLVMQQVLAPFAHKPRLICACAPGDRHELGLMMFSTLMAQREWEVIYLGQNLQLHGLERFLISLAPGLVCVSCSMAAHLSGVVALGKLISPLEPYGLRLAFSGAAFADQPELADDLPGLFLGADLAMAMARAASVARDLQGGCAQATTAQPRPAILPLPTAVVASPRLYVEPVQP